MTMPQPPPRTTRPRAGRCLRTVVWHRQDAPGSEFFELWEAPDGRELSGTVVLAEDGVPLLVRYTVACHVDGSTREAHLVLARGGGETSLTLQVDAQRRWWRDGREVPEVRGCVDVDISCTPSTNTLPIHRLALEVGESREVTAAWVRVPDLSLQPLPQRYTRLAPSRYRYESSGGAFVTEVDVDEQGLVLRYPPGWERVATSGT